LAAAIRRKGDLLGRFLTERLVAQWPGCEARGIGLMRGLDVSRCGGARLAKAVAAECFQRGLILERCGRGDTVLKFLPPLTIDESVLQEACEIVAAAFQAVARADVVPEPVT
jgi:diaminobutyrate-2-oxoglutarate transaminase